jgi:hypothetical protein
VVASHSEHLDKVIIAEHGDLTDGEKALLDLLKRTFAEISGQPQNKEPEGVASREEGHRHQADKEQNGAQGRHQSPAEQEGPQGRRRRGEAKDVGEVAWESTFISAHEAATQIL